MFPRPEHPAPPARPWRHTLRATLDLVVAFATLRDAESPAEAADRLSAHPAPGERPRHAAMGFDRLSTPASGPQQGAPPAHAEHPHRHPLHPPLRARRPGAVRPAAQPCLSPLPARPVARASSPASPR
ncbi:MAG: hypothetical protein QOD81_2822 [Solirubrobacteraceae bacterium]|jgi:hypothetical protein|nr:hypothetical protein [Solirubrobacteraceae bacterium]